jgi:hypothetical protein
LGRNADGDAVFVNADGEREGEGGPLPIIDFIAMLARFTVQYVQVCMVRREGKHTKKMTVDEKPCGDVAESHSTKTWVGRRFTVKGSAISPSIV